MNATINEALREPQHLQAEPYGAFWRVFGKLATAEYQTEYGRVPMQDRWYGPATRFMSVLHQRMKTENREAPRDMCD